MSLKHRFKHFCSDPDELLVGVQTVREFIKRLRKQANTSPNGWDPDLYFGEGFEAFTESLFIQQGLTRKIGISDYSPVDPLQDYGVDGYGKGPDGSDHTVQIKARSNFNEHLTANKDGISNFVAHSDSNYGEEEKLVKYLTVVTTAQDVDERVVQNMYGGRVNVLGYPQLRALVDDFPMFWEIFYKQMKE